MGQVKFVEDSLKQTISLHISKGCLSQILRGPFLNTSSQISVQHQRIGIFCASLSSPKTDVSDSNQNVRTSCKSKLTLTEFKDLCIKTIKKLVKDECCITQQF